MRVTVPVPNEMLGTLQEWAESQDMHLEDLIAGILRPAIVQYQQGKVAALKRVEENPMDKCEAVNGAGHRCIYDTKDHRNEVGGMEEMNHRPVHLYFNKEFGFWEMWPVRAGD